MKNFEQNNALSIIQLEERFEMVVAEGDSKNTTTIEVETN